MTVMPYILFNVYMVFEQYDARNLFYYMILNRQINSFYLIDKPIDYNMINSKDTKEISDEQQKMNDFFEEFYEFSCKVADKMNCRVSTC